MGFKIITTKISHHYFAFYRTLSEVKRVLKPGGKFYYMEHIIAQEVTATFSTPFFKTTKCNGKHEHVVLKV